MFKHKQPPRIHNFVSRVTILLKTTPKETDFLLQTIIIMRGVMPSREKQKLQQFFKNWISRINQKKKKKK